jgi:hypothetical protein
MELLTSVHYLVSKPEALSTVTAVAEEMATWSSRKGKLFSVSDIGVALTRLNEAALVTA